MGNGGISVRLSKLIFERKLMKTKKTNDMVTSEIEPPRQTCKMPVIHLKERKAKVGHHTGILLGSVNLSAHDA